MRRFSLRNLSLVLLLLPTWQQFALCADGPLPAGNSAASTQPSETPEEIATKTRDIHRLLELSGSGKLGVQIAVQMIDQFRKSIPNVPQDFWDQFKQEIKPEELTELVVPVYERHFSDADVRELIKFYESPVGRKLVSTLPQITQEAMAAGQQWGQNLARKVQQRLKDKGYLQT